VAKFFVRAGAQVTVTDLKTAAELRESVQALRGRVKFVLGKHRKEDFLGADLVIRNPAVPWDAPWLKLAHRAGVPVVMDTTLFALWCAGKIIGITGTKGKSTLTALVGHVLRRLDKKTVVAGNIARSPLASLSSIDARTWVVLELSSWQVEGMAQAAFSPPIAVITNIFPDHLNRYPSFAAYRRTKCALVKFQDSRNVAVLSLDRETRRCAASTPARKIYFGPRLKSRLPPGFYYDKAGRIWAQGRKRQRRVGEAGVLSLPLPVAAQHLCALLGIMRGMRLPAFRAWKALRGFRGLPHRLELVGKVRGVRYINDTAATNPGATIMALRAVEGPLVLITGGTEKGLEYGEFVRALTRRRPRAILFLAGSATEEILREARRQGAEWAFPSRVYRSMGAVVSAAAKIAPPGGTVLLSPGAASFELFRDEFDRGEQFRRAVRTLRGEKKYSRRS
jgi:UDP-N-acetylmuramoylalanine--D-glutamate ligase